MNRTPILFLHVLVIATCGLIYELIAGTLASYVLAIPSRSSSLIIGHYLFALAPEPGSRVSSIRIWLAALSRSSWASLSWAAFPRHCCSSVLPTSAIPPGLIFVVFAIGALVGLELPLLMRILKEDLDSKI